MSEDRGALHDGKFCRFGSGERGLVAAATGFIVAGPFQYDMWVYGDGQPQGSPLRGMGREISLGSEIPRLRFAALGMARGCEEEGGDEWMQSFKFTCDDESNAGEDLW